MMRNTRLFRDFIPTSEFYPIFRKIFLIVCIAIIGSYIVCFGSVSPLWATLLFLIPFLFFVVFLKPETGYLLAVLLLPVKNFSLVFKTPNGMLEYVYLFQAMLFLAGLGWFFCRSSRARKEYSGISIKAPVVFLICFCLLSLLWDQDLNHAGIQIFRLLLYIFFAFLCIATVREQERLRWIYYLIILAGIATGVAAIVSLHVNPLKWRYTLGPAYWFEAGFTYSTEIRAGGLASHNQVGFFCNIAIFFSMALFFNSKSYIEKAFLLAAFFITSYGLFLTRSRGASIALTGAMFIFFILTPPISDFLNRHFFKTVVLVLAMIVFLFVVSQFDRLNLELLRLSQTFETKTKEASFARRLIIWGEGIRVSEKDYGFGTGVGGFKQYVLPWPHAHSIYFSAFFDLGFIGLAIWIWLLYELVKRIFEGIALMNGSIYRQYFRGAVAALVALSIHGLVDFEYINEDIWFVGGIVLTTLNLMYMEKTGGIISEARQQ